MSLIEEEFLKESVTRDIENIFYSNFFDYVKESMDNEYNKSRIERKKAALSRHNSHLPEDAIKNMARNTIYEKIYFETLEDEIGSIRNKHTASIVGSMLVNHIRNHPFRFYYDLSDLPLPKPDAVVLIAAAETDRYIEQLYKKICKILESGAIRPGDCALKTSQKYCPYQSRCH